MVMVLLTSNFPQTYAHRMYIERASFAPKLAYQLVGTQPFQGRPAPQHLVCFPRGQVSCLLHGCLCGAFFQHCKQGS